MPIRLQTIYEYISEYTEQEIDDMIYSLSIEEKLLIRDRYGDDLHNPKLTEKWNNEKRDKFYGTLVPKMKRLLKKGRQLKEKTVTPVMETVEEETTIQEQTTIIVEPKIEVIDSTSMLLNLIKEGKTNNEICEELKISSEELYEQLLNFRNRGIKHSRRYYSDGSIKYRPIKKARDLRNYNKVFQERNYWSDKAIITDTNENNMRILVISDLHFGNELERRDLIDRAYNYCVKNGIHIILCAGDLIDGAFTKGTQKISDLYQQIEYFIKNYPHDKNILTFSVAGDHDLSALHASGIDIIEICNNYRHDVVIGGYGNVGINLKNDEIHLYHHLDDGSLRQTDAPIILHGHSHKYSTEFKKGILNVTAPALCDIIHPMPSALELELSFNKGYISNVGIKHLYFSSQDIVLSEASFELLKNRSVEYGDIKYEAPYKKDTTEKQKVLSLSQVEKFNKKYGI